MRRIAIGAVLCGMVLVLASCGASERRTRNRVGVMMDDWISGGTGSGGDIQEAICLWYNGSPKLLPLDHLLHARERFDEWRKEKGLFRKIAAWEITAVAGEASSDPPAMIVSIDIDGKPFRMRVADHVPIEWAP